MKRLCLALILAAVLGTGIFFMEASAMTMAEKPCWQTAPFLAGYRHAGVAGQTLGELYSISWEDTRILAYRTAPEAGAEAGKYALRNLEEIGEMAGRLRAVILGGYPHVRADVLEKQANSWLKDRGIPEIVDLQTGEALLATQMAIWKLTEPSAFREDEIYKGWKDLTAPGWAGYRQKVQDQSSLSQLPAEHTPQNIQALCTYLESLRPLEGGKPLISDAVLEKSTYQATEAADGTWQVMAEVPLDISAQEGDNLTLKATCGNQVQEMQVERAGTYTVSFQGLPEPQAVTVVLEGIQQAADVYLLSGEKSNLLGWAEGTVPVCAQVLLTPERILHIRKTTSQAEGSQPLANIQFHIYLVATQAQVERGEVTPGPEPTALEVESCQRPDNLVAILSTDENGQASYNFTAGGNPDGIYLVVEQFCAGTTGPVDPFYITIPEEGAYSREIHLENGLETQPELTLSVTQRGWTEDTFAIGQNQSWYIHATIPPGMSAAKSYTIWDLLPQGMDLEEETVVVFLENEAGEELRLVPELHYSQSFQEQELEIALTPAGMAYAAANRGEGTGEPGILITFQARLNQDAPIGTPISHRARLSYVNGAGISYSKTSPWVQIQTGGFSICKTDGTGRPLAGNTYRLAQATEEHTGETILLDNGAEIPVVYVSFLTGQTWGKEAVTDEGGRADFSGLHYGSYYLVEARGTGEGPVQIMVDAGSHHKGGDDGEDRTIQLVSTRMLLPDTGGMGAVVLTALGFLAILFAGVLLLLNRKREY